MTGETLFGCTRCTWSGPLKNVFAYKSGIKCPCCGNKLRRYSIKKPRSITMGAIA